MNRLLIPFLITILLYSKPGSSDSLVISRKVKNSVFLQFQLHCLIDSPIELVVSETWRSILDTNYSPPNEKKIILEVKDKEIVLQTLISMPHFFNDRDIIVCNKWDHKKNYEGDKFIWQTCEHEKALPPKERVRIPFAHGSLTFHSSKSGGTIITMKSHSDPGGNIPEFLVNKFSGDRLVEDCHRLRQRINSK